MKKIPLISAITIEAKMMISNMAFLESVVYVANIVVFIALTLSFIGGGTSIIANRWLNKAKDAQANVERNNVKEKFATMQIAVADAQTKQAEAERALLELKIRIAPRKLSDEQKMILTKYLSEPAKHKIVFACRMMDVEGFGYAVEFSEFLRSLKWNVGDVSRIFLDDIKNDIAICITKDGQEADAMRLEKSFLEAGIKATTKETIRQGSFNAIHDAIYLIVGSKKL